MTVAWTKQLGSGMVAPRIAYTPSYHNGKLFQSARDTGNNYKAKLYALDVTDNGEILWTNTEPFDDDTDITNNIVNDDYYIVSSLRYGELTYGKNYIIRQSDGVTLTSTEIPYSTSCSSPNASGGYLTVGGNNGFVAAYDVGSGDANDSPWKGNAYHNGYVGSNLTIAADFAYDNDNEWMIAPGSKGSTLSVAGSAVTMTHRSAAAGLSWIKTKDYQVKDAITEYKITSTTESTGVYDLEPIMIRLSDSDTNTRLGVVLDSNVTTSPDSSNIAQYYDPAGFKTGGLSADLAGHIIGFVANGTSVSLTQDRTTTVGTGTMDAGGNVTGSIGFGTWSTNAAISIDYALVRDYTTPEPTAAFGAEVSPPSATFDNDFGESSSGDITVNYNIIDAESNVSNISQTATSGIEYSTDNAVWADATDAGGASEGLTNLAATPNPGTNHVFVWDSVTDIGEIQDSSVYLRIRPNDGTFDANSWVTSNAFAVNNNTAPSATFDNDFSLWSSGDITVNYNIIDVESNTCNISQTVTSGIEYSTDNAIWADATDAGGASEGLTNLAATPNPGTNHIFVWDSETDLGTTEDETVYLRVRPNDGTVSAAAWVTSSAFQLDNQPPTGLGVLTATSVSSTGLTLNWTTLTEGFFDHYEIWWGLTESCVISENLTCASKKDNATNTALASKSTTSLEFTGLTENRVYYFRVVAHDEYGNESASATYSFNTLYSDAEGGGTGGASGSTGGSSSTGSDEGETEFHESSEENGSNEDDGVSSNEIGGSEQNTSEGEEEILISGFSDINSSPERDYIVELAYKEIITGREPGKFYPEEPINRAEFLKIISLAFENEEDIDEVSVPFTDVDEDAWYYEYIKKAYALGLIKGYEDGTFKPGKNLNRAEALKILFGAAQVEVSEEQNSEIAFSDVNANAWYTSYIVYADEIGIISGYEDGTFKPDNSLLRGEAAKIVAEMM